MASDLAPPCACEDGAWRLSGVGDLHRPPIPRSARKKHKTIQWFSRGYIYIYMYIYNIYIYTY